MFSVKRRFRKPIGFALLFVFLWIFVIDDEEYSNEIQDNQRPPHENVRKVETFAQDTERHKNEEDVIFGQGILLARSSSRKSQDHSRLVRGPENDITVSSKKTGDTLIKDNGSSQSASSIRYKIGQGENLEDTMGIMEMNGKNYREMSETGNYPQRYKNSIAESLRQEPDTSSILEEDSSSSRHSVWKRNRQKFPPGWMRITDDIYTYSAFWDDRKQLSEGPVARILGILRLKKELLREENKFLWKGTVREELLNCTCLLWYRGERKAEVGILKAHIFDEGRKEYGGTFFLCYPQKANITVMHKSYHNNSNGENLRAIEPHPYAVSIYPNNTVNAPHKLIYLGHNTISGSNNPVKHNSSAVCVRALFGPYDDVGGIAQFVSYYTSVLNVSHFYFYNLAMAPQVSELLELYRGLGLTFEILPWNLPTSEWDELWDMGSLVALNDCIYRGSEKHGLVAIVDLDEFIVPKKPFQDLGGLYRDTLTFRRGEHGDAVLILNVFFCFDFKEAVSLGKKNESFPIFEYTRRESRLWPPNSRSKIIVVPQTVTHVGHHMVHAFVSKTLTNRSASKSIAALHHYRICQDIRLGMFGTGKKVLGEPTSKDLSMLRYKKLIMNSKTMKLYKKFFT